MRIVAIILIVLGLAMCVISFLGLLYTVRHLADEAYVFTGNATTATVLGEILQDRITLLYGEIYGGNVDTSNTPELKAEKDSIFKAQAIYSVEEALNYHTVKKYFDPDYYHLDFIDALDDAELDEKFTTLALELIINNEVIYRRGNIAKSPASGLIFDVPRYEKLRGFKVNIYSSMKFEEITRTNIRKLMPVYYSCFVLIIVGVVLLIYSQRSSRVNV